MMMTQMFHHGERESIVVTVNKMMSMQTSEQGNPIMKVIDQGIEMIEKGSQTIMIVIKMMELITLMIGVITGEEKGERGDKMMMEIGEGETMIGILLSQVFIIVV